VELTPGAHLTAQDVQTYLANKLARYKVPKRVDFHASLPRQDSGKIFKRHLRDPFWQGHGRAI
jgi:long-chain acyl-CoA synthetase